MSSDLKDKIDRKDKELENVQQKLIDAVDEERTVVKERLQTNASDRKWRLREQDNVTNGGGGYTDEDSPRGNEYKEDHGSFRPAQCDQSLCLLT